MWLNLRIAGVSTEASAGSLEFNTPSLERTCLVVYVRATARLTGTRVQVQPDDITALDVLKAWNSFEDPAGTSCLHVRPSRVTRATRSALAWM